MYPAVPNIYDYELVSRIGSRPVTALEVAEHLKYDSSLVTGDFQAYLESLIDTAVLVAERYTRRTFIDSNFKAYLDRFQSGCNYEIRRSPFGSMTSITRSVSSVQTVIDSNSYYVSLSHDFSRVALMPGYAWPIDQDAILHAIVFTFVAGYTNAEFPVDLKQALLIHIAAMYSQRGDCEPSGGGQCASKCSIPTQAKNIYDQYKIYDMRIGL
jgi:uncharacterized phiE125 gp8 family phage protein